LVRTLVLSDEEANYLSDILDNWIEGHKDAFEMTIDDPTHEDVEDMLDAVSGLDEQVRMAVTMKGQIDG
jgi:hypothetical protein